MNQVAEAMLRDIDKDTVDFIPNYDGSQTEPTVLPGAFPVPGGKRRKRHCRRHGHKHSSAQPPGDLRSHRHADRLPGRLARGSDEDRARA